MVNRNTLHNFGGPVARLCVLAWIACIAATGVSSAQSSPKPNTQNPIPKTQYPIPCLAAPASISYEISLPESAPDRYHVRVTVAHPSGSQVTFAIPAWTPGYYQILHYEQGIENVRAEDADGKPLKLDHPQPRVWQASEEPSSASEPVTLAYDVHAEDSGLGFFGSVLRSKDRIGFINGASALMYVVDHLREPVTLALDLPKQWKVGTPLQPAEGGRREGNGARTQRFEAASYDDLIDCPLQLGAFDETDFKVEGVPFRCLVTGKASFNKASLASVLTRIAKAGMNVFGGPRTRPPFSNYVFFYHCGGNGFSGGLEHHSSTVIHLDTREADGVSDGFATVTAHEFFHAWNVKRIHPSVLGPFDYTQPVRTASIWFAEGVTDYYADIILLRSGLRDRDWFLRDITGRIAELDETPARARITVEEAARHAWEGESEGFQGLSYYTKGSLIGFYFDLRLRELTQGRKGLDDVMRLLYQQYGQPDIGYPETALASAINEVAGTDLSDEYRRYVSGTADFDWDSVLAPFGLQLKREAVSYLGIRVREIKETRGKSLFVESIDHGLAGDSMGLHLGDRILQLNGQTVDSEAFTRLLRAQPADSPVALQILRDDKPAVLQGKTGVHYINLNLRSCPKRRRQPRP